MLNPAPSFFIGNLPIYGKLVLAPMDGISTYPFRSLTREIGSAISYSEFISANDVLHPPPNLESHLYFQAVERPLAYQLLDHDPARMVQAALNLLPRNPDFFDVNLGCPARQVTSHGAGAGLLKEPEKVSLIFKELVHALPVPVTAKIRLGWTENSRNYLDIAHRLEDSGAALIAVHGRTRKQGYAGPVDWEAIAEIKQAVRIPVLANGNICCVEDIQRVIHFTGCEGVMIGRHAIQNPWIFSMRDRMDISLTEVVGFLKQLLNRMVFLYQLPVGAFRFRRYFVDITRPYPLSEWFRKKCLSSVDLSELSDLLDSWRFENSSTLLPGQGIDFNLKS
jgi:tRNA-dihydrouridine synthase B